MAGEQSSIFQLQSLQIFLLCYSKDIGDHGRELEDTARYAGLLLAPAEGFGLRPRAFFALREYSIT